MEIMVPAWVDGTLQPVEKLAAHERGLRHMAVSVFVISDGKLLMQQRALGKYHTPGLWANTCCTHPHWDEPPEDCAARRLDEELGITGLALQHRGRVEYRADVGGGLIEHEVVEVYLAHAAPDLTITENPDEVMATRWITLGDLHADLAQHPDAYTPWLRIYMAEHEGLILGGGAME
ncbi:isopentenyl-diphosphate Delta-isomerase [Sulfitobacter sp. KE34]|uniref:Isopentenyl-diphosphate Delta-isomerase n=1 Tax=Sulfitobacter faviae TaxID=1775881 RepID=A0AAX3LNY9_9RHOB|nr:MULTISPECIES: isopentenyl-diphosphate Delta-isomerase [Sulfitobacter]MDF3349938.1 isopentenyl-diphosphate Delta-isomerase [Sulfitobacter sp. KE12]MDF3353610.1 isopentenyl-diphosphate Delta-isomerase [Sulfitobacter sp. KE27]MDF3357258.1 isopentenyl-diphosphate Delta-isomerase [Sulfitobacter sp. KE33]MDF3361619.1 isopentenyl-diphosphate Delta-isomerase [Sulfitobacter sp. Ks41]MDF3364682.1 isopentenyl-diphosphate Delta-isomerase [Sulfitobacter sp. Ks34]